MLGDAGEEYEQRRRGIPVRGQLIRLGGKRCHQLLHDGRQQRLLGREVPEHGADRHPGPPGHFLGRGRGPLLGEDLGGGGENQLPVASRVGSHQALL
jgi:hypothetical protein